MHAGSQRDAQQQRRLRLQDWVYPRQRARLRRHHRRAATVLRRNPVPRNGRCTSVTPKCEPGPGEYRNDEDRCVCKRGLERDGRGRCIGKPTPKCEPGPGEYRNDEDRCVCKRGFERDDNGRCVEPRNPADDCRKKGKVWDGKRCIEQSNPADDCRKKGWTWTGKRCVEPTSPADDCRKQGKVWDGKRCIEQSNPGDDCRKKGWTWTGKRCVEPAPKPCPRGTTGSPPNCKLVKV